ncbi:hypothetical protein KC349_g6452 [Hortaea werneckii]|nr:hypothetical protein KC349_g6452 [Hortaea werneckii]
MAMLRSAATRSLLRSLNTRQPVQQQFRSQLSTLSASSARPTTALRPFAPKTVSLVRWQATGRSGDRQMVDEIDKANETELQKEKLQARPDIVSTESSTRTLGEVGVQDGSQKEHDDHEMMGGIKSDLNTIRETFSLKGVPKEAYYVGMAGVIPYAATSLSTVYCAWEINRAAATGAGFLMSERTAELALHAIEPLQIGYGAVIISFLGAIHWGLEWAGFGGYKGYSRYQIGVVSTALAWPTILLPAEYALISQFLIFNFLYYTDSRASKRGWAPAWYGVYRFVLTFIVGSAIVASLIGRGQIADRIGRLPGPGDRIRALRQQQEEMVVEEEEARRNFLGSSDEEEEEEEEDEE